MASAAARADLHAAAGVHRRRGSADASDAAAPQRHPPADGAGDYDAAGARAALVAAMTERFLAGHDGAFIDYRDIDGDAALDDSSDGAADAADAYFLSPA